MSAFGKIRATPEVRQIAKTVTFAQAYGSSMR